MDMRKIIKQPLVIFGSTFLILTVVLIGVFIYQVKGVTGGLNDISQSGVQTVEDEKKEYQLPKQATAYQKEIFDDLIKAQEAYQTDQTEQTTKDYASLVVKNFIADFYTWTNKTNHSDVGGIQFINEEMQATFKKQAIDGYYETLDYYLEHDGAASLMSVEEVNLSDVNLNDTIEVEGEEGEMEQKACISVLANWSYAPTSLNEGANLQTQATFLLTSVEGRLVINAILSE